MTARRKKPPHPPLRCRICLSPDGPPWTEEHAYPRWVRKLIRTWYESMPKGMLDPAWNIGAKTVLKPVCVPCQRRLNDVFENTAKPLLLNMITGQQVVLSPRQQVLIAGWYAKTELVLGLCPGRKEMFTPDEVEQMRLDLREMLDTGTPPMDRTTRLGYVTDRLQQSVIPLLPRGWPDERRFRQGMIISTLRVLSETIVGDVVPPQSFIDATKDDNRFMRIWPPNVTSQLWPPPIWLGLGDVSALRTAWGQPEKPFGNYPGVLTPPANPKAQPSPQRSALGSESTPREG